MWRPIHVSTTRGYLGTSSDFWETEEEKDKEHKTGKNHWQVYGKNVHRTMTGKGGKKI